MSDSQDNDEMIKEFEDAIDDTKSDASQFDNVKSEIDNASQLEDEFEDSITGGGTNASDFTANSESGAKSDELSQKVDIVDNEKERVDKENLEKGRMLAKHGIFSAHELTDETLFTSSGKLSDRHSSKRYHTSDCSSRELNDPGSSDRHCILRLPESAANIIKERIHAGEDPQMTIEPTGRYDYREYKIVIGGIDKPLYGILGELPCIIEAHKTLNCDLLFKSADISQLMVAYEEDATDAAEELKDKIWEWQDGITPATKNIRKRKFKNFEVYTNEEVKEAEREALIILNGLIRDTYHFEIKSAQEVFELVKSYRNGNIKERIIGPDEDVDTYIKALEQQETEELPDLSEIMFDSDLNSITNKYIAQKLRVFNK